MRIFLDTSVLLAACGSARGASYALFEEAASHGWILVTSPYVLEEARNNLSRVSVVAHIELGRFLSRLSVVEDALTFPWINVFRPSKDRPVLFTAHAHADVLLTLDEADFARFLGLSFFSLPILRPGVFIERTRGGMPLI